ncbi:hypothetical protein GCM10010435_37700 [Winogradskya consettensis]|uniref:DNA mismatch repair protein MutT n=1 Tax=Winogradskya consettensis TaxID=113560 RepID=A0A919T3P5_9ACTN|nr:NUDIX domain-containing protein [Actinoplanes consettensis]GIM83818.1 DNA mismatch repair protein MutT [Actinoplanes consettensis]
MWVCVRDRRLLVVRTHGLDVFYLPGGTPEAGESPAETVIREVAEETGIRLDPAALQPFAEFVEPAHGRPGTVRLICFTGPGEGEPHPADEIAEAAWFTSADLEKCAPGLHPVIRTLADSGEIY